MADVPGGGDSTSPLDLVSFVKAKTKKLRSSGTLVPSSEEVLGKGGAESKMLQGTDGKSKIRKSGEATGKHTTRKANVTWHYLTPTGTLAPRWGHSAAIIGSKLYIMGGTGNKVYGEMYTFDLEINAWSMMPSQKGTPPGPRFGHSSSPTSASTKELIFFGGRGAGNKHYNDVHVLDIETHVWKRFPPSKNSPEPRAGHTFNLFDNGKMVLYGGQTKHKYLDGVYTLDYETKTWTKEKEVGDIPPPRGGHSAVAWNNYLFVFGGFNGRKYFNDLYSLDINTWTWKEIPTTGRIPAPRSGHSLTLVDGDYLMLFGGCGSSSNFLNDVCFLHLEKMVWYQAAVKGPSLAPRFRHSATLVDPSHVYYFGGSGSGVLFNDIAVLDLDQRSLALATSSPPPPLEPADVPASPPYPHKGEPEFVEVVKVREPIGITTLDGMGEPPIDPEKGESETTAPSQIPPSQFPALPNGQVPSVEEVMKMYVGMAMALRSERQQRERMEMSLRKLERAMFEDRLAREQIEEKRATVEGELLCVQEAKQKLENAKVKAEKSLKAERKKSKKEERSKEATIMALKGELAEEKERLDGEYQAERRKRKRAKAKLLKLKEESQVKEAEIQKLRAEMGHSKRQSRIRSGSNETHQLELALLELNKTQEQLKQQEDVNTRLKEELQQWNGSPQARDFNNMGLEELIKLEDFYHQALKAVGNAKQQQLQRQLEELKRAKAVLEDQKLCTICCDREIRIVLIPCGHRTLCKSCGEILQKCPLCRAEITARIESY